MELTFGEIQSEYYAAIRQADADWYAEYEEAAKDWYAIRQAAYQEAYDSERDALASLRIADRAVYLEYLDAAEWAEFERIDELEASSILLAGYLIIRRAAYEQSNDIEDAATIKRESRREVARATRDAAKEVARATYDEQRAAILD